jgi:hypothetical protein
MSDQEKADFLRETAEAVMAERWGGRVWRLCAFAWLTARADRLAPRKAKR